MFVLCVVSKDKKAKCTTIKTKKQVQMTYKQSTRYKKNPGICIFFNLFYCLLESHMKE
jgi:hypothetical protein